MGEPDVRPDRHAGQPDHDLEDRRHHRRVMTIAFVAVIILLGAMVWVAQMIIAQQKLERCLSTGRRDCLIIEKPQPAEDSASRTSADAQ